MTWESAHLAKLLWTCRITSELLRARPFIWEANAEVYKTHGETLASQNAEAERAIQVMLFISSPIITEKKPASIQRYHLRTAPSKLWENSLNSVSVSPSNMSGWEQLSRTLMIAWVAHALFMTWKWHTEQKLHTFKSAQHNHWLTVIRICSIFTLCSWKWTRAAAILTIKQKNGIEDILSGQ